MDALDHRPTIRRNLLMARQLRARAAAAAAQHDPLFDHIARSDVAVAAALRDTARIYLQRARYARRTLNERS